MLIYYYLEVEFGIVFKVWILIEFMMVMVWRGWVGVCVGGGDVGWWDCSFFVKIIIVFYCILRF